LCKADELQDSNALRGLAIAYFVHLNAHVASTGDSESENDSDSQDEVDEEEQDGGSSARSYSGMSLKASTWASKVCMQLLVNSVSTFWLERTIFA
jgi:hypothetical protein